MYIYEGHMGGLYCTDDVQDWESLYCEQCGDSDWELGYAETLEDAWKLLKDKTATFDDSKCLTCPHDEGYEYCDEHCEDYKHSGGYNLNYIMQFLVENFECDKLHYIYLISKHEEDKNYVFVNVKPNGCGFGENHSLPYCVSPFGDYVNQLARSLTSLLDGPASDIKEVYVEERKDKVIHIFECIERVDEDWYYNENWREAASYKDNSWYGYMKREYIKLIDEQKELEKYL